MSANLFNLQADQIEKFRKTRIVCVGDVMLDRFIYGEVSRISPEAPIPVCRVLNETSMLGGGGNVVRNLVAIGASVDFVSVTGKDEIAKNIEILLEQLEGVTYKLVTDTSRVTTDKTRYVAAGQQLLRADKEVIFPIAEDIADAIIETVKLKLDGAGALIISDYGKGVITQTLASRLIKEASHAAKPVIVDPKAVSLRPYSGAKIVTPNLNELCQVTGRDINTNEEIIKAARELVIELQLESMLVTRGAQGMTLVTGKDSHHIPSCAREVYDVSGAGDTVVAFLSAAIASGLSEIEAAELANVAAGLVVAKAGTAVVHADELYSEISDNVRMDPANSPMHIDPALDWVKTWKNQDKKIGFTNGCFDLLHPGHVSLLAMAKASCDKLIVALNTDSSVKRLKGNDRPKQDELARAAMLSSLKSVDLVILFGDNTPEKILRAIKPDVLIKGKDYTIETVIGADFVKSYGGEVLLADIVPGYSTTAIISQISSS